VTARACDPGTPKLTSWCTDPNAVFGGADFDGDRLFDFVCHDPTLTDNPGRLWTAPARAFYAAP